MPPAALFTLAVWRRYGRLGYTPVTTRGVARHLDAGQVFYFWTGPPTTPPGTLHLPLRGVWRDEIVPDRRTRNGDPSRSGPRADRGRHSRPGCQHQRFRQSPADS